MRSGTQVSRFTGDGYPSPTRRESRRQPVRRPTGFPQDIPESEVTESSFESRPPRGPYVPPTRPGGAPPGAPPVPMHGSHSGSRHDVNPVSMPPMPGDPHGVLYSEGESSYRSGPGRSSSRRRRAEEEAFDRENRDRYGSPHSQPVSVKLKVHDDKDRNVTLRRLTEEEALAARGARGRADSESSLSGMESPSQGRRYRREANQRRAEKAAEKRTEEDRLAPLSPPNPAFAKGRRGKDSAYYSGQPGPSGSTPAAGQTMSSLGSLASPDSHGTWSAMSHSPSGPDKASESAAADNRRRRRIERRRGSSSRPTGTDMFD